MEEIAKLIANYSILIVIAMLYLWDSIEMKNTNINIYKSLEIIQSDLKDVKEKVGERR